MDTKSFKEGVTNYGLGSITDGINKLEINILNFKNSKKLKKGTGVFVKGYLKFPSKYE